MDAATIGIIVTVVIAWSTLLLAVIKILLDRYLTAVTAQIVDLAGENKELKKEITKLREELPVLYVRQDHCKNCRDEWMRIVGIIDQKLESFSDRMGEKIDQLRKDMYERPH